VAGAKTNAPVTPANPGPPDLDQVFRRLLRRHGPQHWWPADSRFEVMVGAVLVQNTRWRGAERAIENLTPEERAEPRALLAMLPDTLADAIRPAGYFRVKARRLRNLAVWLLECGGVDALHGWETDALCSGLLTVNGIGRETADAIVQYAFERPRFVVDAYARRLLHRLGWIRGDECYLEVQRVMEFAIHGRPVDPGELHALIVRHGQCHCRSRPVCPECPIQTCCPAAEFNLAGSH